MKSMKRPKAPSNFFLRFGMVTGDFNEISSFSIGVPWFAVTEIDRIDEIELKLLLAAGKFACLICPMLAVLEVKAAVLCECLDT